MQTVNEERFARFRRGQSLDFSLLDRHITAIKNWKGFIIQCHSDMLKWNNQHNCTCIPNWAILHRIVIPSNGTHPRSLLNQDSTLHCPSPKKSYFAHPTRNTAISSQNRSCRDPRPLTNTSTFVRQELHHILFFSFSISHKLFFPHKITSCTIPYCVSHESQANCRYASRHFT